MAPRLTDRQKKKIVADYLETGSYNATAEKNGVCGHTVKRIVAECPEISEKIEQKKNENTADILAYMESKRGVVCEIIEKGLTALNDPAKLAESSPAQITTALGTIIDKWALKNSIVSTQKKSDMQALADILRNPAPDRKIEDFEE